MGQWLCQERRTSRRVRRESAVAWVVAAVYPADNKGNKQRTEENANDRRNRAAIHRHHQEEDENSQDTESLGRGDERGPERRSGD